MRKSIVISEQDSIAALLENDRVVEFFVNRGELLLGDIYTASVENILPGIDAAFVNLGKDKMGFLHANDVPGQGLLKERLVPKQKLLVQVTKEPTGHKGPRVSTAISLPGRFLVLVPEERGISISRRIGEARERSRLKSVVNLMKPPGVGLIIRTEAKGQGENELFEDFEQLWDRWQTVVSEGEASIGPTLIYRDQDLLYRVIRDAYSHDINEIIVDNTDGQRRAQEYLQGWANRQTKIVCHTGADTLLVARGIDREIEAALLDRVELPSGGHLNIQPTEALTVIDVNSGRFTSSRTQAETVRRTNLEAAQEIPRQLRLRNIGGMVIVDFIDMDSRKDQQQVLEMFQRVLEEDRAKPQVGQLSDLGLVELTRRRQGQSLRELFTVSCSNCSGLGVIPTLEIGPLDNRRTISFKFKDEELSRGRSIGKKSVKQAGVMVRAASASNGRVFPLLQEPSEEQESMLYVPEDILAQMPDELLQDQPGNIFDQKGNVANYQSDTMGDIDSDLEESELTSVSKLDVFEADERSFAPEDVTFNHVLQETEETGFGEDLAKNIRAVEQVHQDIESSISQFKEQSTNYVVEQDDQNSPVHEVETIDLAGTGLNQEDGTSSHTQTFNPFEAEADPVTGVYRLRTKSAFDDRSVSTGITDDSEQEKIASVFNEEERKPFGYSDSPDENSIDSVEKDDQYRFKTDLRMNSSMEEETKSVENTEFDSEDIEQEKKENEENED